MIAERTSRKAADSSDSYCAHIGLSRCFTQTDDVTYDTYFVNIWLLFCSFIFIILIIQFLIVHTADDDGDGDGRDLFIYIFI